MFCVIVSLLLQFPTSGLAKLQAFKKICLVLFCLQILTPTSSCRDELKRHYNLGQYWIEVEMEDLASFDEDLADYLYKQPAEHLQLVRMGNTVEGNTPRTILFRAKSWCATSHLANQSGVSV